MIKFTIIEDFSVEANDSAMSVFNDTYNLKSLIAFLHGPYVGNQTAKFQTFLRNRNRLVWFSQDNSHSNESNLYDTSTESSKL